MLKIGFVDYFLDEWHANNYPKWFRAASEKLGEELSVSYAWAELDLPPEGGKSTDEWCSAMGVERCSSLAELCEKSDAIVILSPDNPERHLDYARAVLPILTRLLLPITPRRFASLTLRANITPPSSPPRHFAMRRN